MLDRLFQPLDHAVQRKRQAFDLIPGANNRETLSDTFRADTLSLFCAFANRLQWIFYQDQSTGHSPKQKYWNPQRESQPDTSELVGNQLVRCTGLNQETLAIWCNISKTLEHHGAGSGVDKPRWESLLFRSLRRRNLRGVEAAIIRTAGAV